MSFRRELCFEEKMNLIKDKERDLSHRGLSRFQVSVGAVCPTFWYANVVYINDYEPDQNKKLERKMEDDLNQEVNANVYEWFVVQRERNVINQLQ